jgi:hypothetical protein
VYARPRVKWSNQELPDLSRGPYEARRNVFRRIKETGARLGAAGMIGIQFEQRIERAEETHNLLITLHVLGTGIVQVAQHGRPQSSTTLTLALNDDRGGGPPSRPAVEPSGHGTEHVSRLDQAQHLGRSVAGRFAARRARESR